MQVKINGKAYGANDLALLPKPTPSGMTWDIVRISDKKVIENTMELIPGLRVSM